MVFSILIPTWNNLDFLKLCVASIRKNSAVPHQIIVHVNEGVDGTLAWVQAEGLDYTHSPQNIGVCYSTNHAATLAKHDYLVFMNDDMYCAPGWDLAFFRVLKQLPGSLFMLFSRLIEPGAYSGHNLRGDFGTSPAEFDELAFLSAIPQFPKEHFQGASQPTLISREWWAKVGGYSLEFSPGMGSDDDLCMKFWRSGCRIFLIVGDSFVYHFGQKSTKRIAPNNSRLQFRMKWGISTHVFERFYLRSGTPADQLSLPEPEISVAYRWAWFKLKWAIIKAVMGELFLPKIK